MKSNSLLKFIIFSNILFLWAGKAGADIIKFNSGQILTVDILERTPQYIKGKLAGVNVTFYPNEIKEIIPPVLEKAPVKVVQPAFKEEPVVVKPVTEVHATSISLGGATVVEPKQNSKIINDFVMGIFLFDQETGKQLDEHTKAVDALMEKDHKDEAIGLVIKETDYISQRIKYLRTLSAPQGTEDLISSIIKYYESMLAVQASVLKFLSGAPNGSQSVDTATQTMVGLGNNFEKILEKYKGKYSVALPSVLPSRAEQLQDENDSLIKETRELMATNRQLQAETQSLLKKNKKMQEEMIKMVQATIRQADQEQRATFLKYLQSL